MKRKPLSLTLRLISIVLTLNIATICIVAVLGLRSANIKIAEEYDAQLITETSVLWQILREDVIEGDTEELNISGQALAEKMQQETLNNYAQWRAFRIWKDGKVAIQSDNAADMSATPLAPGFSDTLINGETWRVFGLHVPKEGMVVETFENLRNRELLQRDILFGIAGPLIVMLPLLALLFYFGIRLGLSGLYRLAARLETRSPFDLSRMESHDIPRELRPLANAINTLLGTLEAALAHEREFIDHAAHELRTPLSALKLQAQLLAKSLTDPVKSADAQALLAGVDRTARLVDQLLLLSRVTQHGIALEGVNLHGAAKEVVSLYAVRIVDKHIALALQGDETAMVRAQPELLRTLIGTILDNAIKYTPDGGEITILVERRPAEVALTISDSGPGIPAHERERVFDRFYRIPDTRQTGSGLGLTIASQIAELLNAGIMLEAATPAGLRVTLAFPTN